MSKIYPIVSIYVGFCISTIVFSTKISNLKKVYISFKKSIGNFHDSPVRLGFFKPNRINTLEMAINFNSFIIIKVYNNKATIQQSKLQYKSDSS